MSSTTSASPDLRLTALLWTAGPLLAWAVFPYVGYLSTPALELHLWSDVARVTGWLAGNGTLLGLVTAAAQAIALPPAWGDRPRWFIRTLLAYMVALPVGFLMAVLAPWGLARPMLPLLLQPSSPTLYFPTAVSMLAIGFVLALIQGWLCLRGWSLTWPARLLWCFGGVLIWALGFIVSGYAAAFGMPMDWCSPVAGAVIGALSFGLLLVLRRAGQSTLTPIPAPSAP